MDLRWIVHSCFMYYVHIHVHGDFSKTTKASMKCHILFQKTNFFYVDFINFLVVRTYNKKLPMKITHKCYIYQRCFRCLTSHCIVTIHNNF